MSNAYCSECVGNGAEPEWSFGYLYDFVANGILEAIHTAYHDNLITFKDGRYWKLREWFDWRHFQWFTPDPYCHWWAFKPNGPLEDTTPSPFPLSETDLEAIQDFDDPFGEPKQEST